MFAVCHSVRLEPTGVSFEFYWQAAMRHLTGIPTGSHLGLVDSGSRAQWWRSGASVAEPGHLALLRGRRGCPLPGAPPGAEPAPLAGMLPARERAPAIPSADSAGSGCAKSGPDHAATAAHVARGAAALRGRGAALAATSGALAGRLVLAGCLVLGGEAAAAARPGAGAVPRAPLRAAEAL